MKKLIVFGAILAALSLTACNRNGPKGPPAKAMTAAISINLS
jgi:predicted small lipoprotein YifL